MTPFESPHLVLSPLVEQGRTHLTIRTLTDRRAIGNATLTPVGAGMQIAFDLEANHVGQDHAREAVTALLRIAFDKLRAAFAVIRCCPADQRTAEMARACGFERVFSDNVCDTWTLACV